MEYLDIIPFRNEVSSEVYIPGSKVFRIGP